VASGGVEARLLGRRGERGALERVLDRARAGSSAVLVVRGEPGIGKTALLDYAASRASGFRVVRAAGVESEMELPFAGLHMVCSIPPMLGRLEKLPGPQRDALRVAFGLQEGDVPDRFLIGLAVLSLLADVAEDQPLACLVDDAQWLDQSSVQALAFVARRLLAEPVALIFAAREPSDEDELAGLPDLTVSRLGDRDARALLTSAVHGRLDPQVRDRIVAETGGNPLALLQLPRGLGPGDLAGGFWLPGTRPLASRIEHSFHRQFQALPRHTQRLLLTAAAEPVGDVTLLWRAARLQEIPTDAAAPAEAAGLVEFGAAVRFAHPLARSAVYRWASPGDRRTAHCALAEATDAQVDPDRRAWHLAEAAAGPDEDVAAELMRAADRAQARGGLAAAAALLERAAALTPEPSRRAQRALAAAQTKYEAGALDDALALLGTAEAGAVDDPQRARVHLLRAQIAFASKRGSDAPQLLLRAARELEAVDPNLARATYIEALSAAMFAGRLARGGGAEEISEAALAGPPPPAAPGPSGLLLQGLAVQFTAGYAAGAPIIKQALRAFRQETVLPPQEARWLWFASWVALHLWDDEAWTVLSTRHLELVREAGALTALPFVLTNRSSVYAWSGELAAAASIEEELRAATEATGIAPVPYGALSIAALRGREAEFSELIETSVSEAEARGEGLALTVTEMLSGTLYLGLGRYDAALAAVRQAVHYQKEGPAIWTLTELIEAAARSGQPQLAGHALELLAETTRASGTDWALGMEALCRALVSDGDAAERRYREAIERLAPARLRVQFARAHLLYGEWLRRQNRHVDAREQLRIAYQMLTAMGMEGFAERARQELLATGETVRKRTVETLAELTAQEAQIARLARDGRTNQEISTQMFISPRTVEWHLGNVFTKLGITSRKQLR
jgi:DNA-binding CsgD family transcriptional regulator